MEQDLLTARERGALWLRLGIRAVLTIAAVLLVIYVVLPLLSLLLPFVLALIVAWLLNPLLRRLQKKLSVSRKVLSMVLIILLFCIIGGVLTAIVWVAVGELKSLFENWSSVTDAILGVAGNVGDWLNGLGKYLPAGLQSAGSNLSATVMNWIRNIDFSGWIGWATERAPDLVSGVSHFGVATIVFIMASYFITGDYPRLRFLLTDRVPEDARAFCSSVKKIFMDAFGGYLKSQLILSLGVCVILAVGFSIMGQPYGLVMACGLAVMDFIPIIGAGTIMVPWTVVDIITGNYMHALGFAVIWGLIVVFRRVAEPKILGDQTGLSPILSLVGIYVGMRLGGVLGMVIGPLLILVCINLVKMGIFAPVMADIRRCVKDVRAILRQGREK